ncbi:hypothetical protein [Psychromonas algicola]|uniref:hypothetical protein n=1 Tax=Psychromonas algicola TaxID=2555642 RepID=UPI0010686F21|nr:hypothetical protein [Psychromonas sp. RZ5]TEW44236.1 hypothetical protein E2R67_15120 [Psychromonas sp. RZ5]
MRKKIVLIFFLLILIIYNVTNFYVDAQISQIKRKDIYNDCHKIWSARGIYTSKEEQNSIAALQKAFELGALGAEFDFYYDTKLDKFIVSHSPPKKDKDGNLIYLKKNGELLTLEKLFKAVGDGHYFWLDYKNLDRISSAETKRSIVRLNEISKNNSLKDRLYLEGSNPFRLADYSDAGFKTLFAGRPLPENNIFATISANLFKMAYYFNNLSAITMKYGDKNNPYYGQKAESALKGVPIFLFHVDDDESLLKELVKKEDVRVMLAGRDKSLNRFYINNCQLID